MKKSFLTNVIAPLRLVDRTVFIFISSPGTATAYYTQLMKSSAFNTIKFGMACAACEKTKTPWKCTHMLGEIPHWQSEESVEKAKKFLVDDPFIAYRELMGGVIDDAAKVFSLDLLNDIEAKPHVGYGLSSPKYVFISIDPAGGGSSQYAITSCFYTGPVCVVRHLPAPPAPPAPLAHASAAPTALVVAYPSSLLLLLLSASAIVVTTGAGLGRAMEADAPPSPYWTTGSSLAPPTVGSSYARAICWMMSWGVVYIPGAGVGAKLFVPNSLKITPRLSKNTFAATAGSGTKPLSAGGLQMYSRMASHCATHMKNTTCLRRRSPPPATASMRSRALSRTSGATIGKQSPQSPPYFFALQLAMTAASMLSIVACSLVYSTWCTTRRFLWRISASSGESASAPAVAGVVGDALPPNERTPCEGDPPPPPPGDIIGDSKSRLRGDISLARARGLIVCGLESRSATFEGQKAIPVDHIKRLQRLPLFSRSWFVVQIESNLGFESDHHAAGLQKDPDIVNLVFMRECEARVGTRTSHGTKEQMTLLMMEAVSMQSVVFYDQLVTTEDDAPVMKRLLFRQLENYSAKGSVTGKRIYTGKLNHEQDDLAMTLMMNMLYFRKFQSEPQYARFRRDAPR